LSAGDTLARIRDEKPLVHQITNYVVMNETANATLALGALPVMAHAPQEVEEMASIAGALVLNIGTLSEHWIEAMLLAGRAAAGPIVLDPVGVGATRYRTETAKRLLDDHISDGERVIAVSNGHELLGTVSGTGCMATAVTGAFLAVKPGEPLEAAAEALVAFGVAGEDAARDAKGPGTFHAALYDALYNLDPATLDERARIDE
jgi:hydroxyethylthiazole kinase